MTTHEGAGRRNHVDERVALAVGIVAGMLAAAASAAPTGVRAVDVIVVALGVGAVVWASASAPWWALAAAAGVAAVVAVDPLAAVIGASAFGAALLIGIRRRDLGWLRALVAAVVANVLIRSELGGFLGLSALVGVATCAALFVLGLQRRPSRVRRRGWTAAAAVGVVGLAAVVVTGAATVVARSDVLLSSRTARQGIEALDEGDYEAAAELLGRAADGFGRADVRFGGALASSGRLVPVLSQNLRAAADLSAAAADSLAEASRALRDVAGQDRAVVGGTVDLDAIVAVEEPLLRVREAIAAMRAATREVRSPWLIAPVQDELADLEAEFDEKEPRLDDAIDAVRLAPAMLGVDGPRRYLILFTSPSEARGLGGFIGNYAEVVVDDGTFTVTELARRSELERYVRRNGASCGTCPEELLGRYGRFGFTTGPDGGVGDRVWSNLTMPAHFPYVAEAAADLYPQSGGSPVDGVIVMDPYVIAALMQYTGPIDVPELGVTVEPDDAAWFILHDQYALATDDRGAIDNPNRVDALESLGQSVVTGLLAGRLPPPEELAGVLAPLVDERRLLMWTAPAAERDLLARTGLLGALPETGDSGGFSVSVTNAGASKIDVFLRRTVDVSVEPAPDGGRRLVAEVTLTNTAPASGLPEYLIGNSVGLPDGSSRLFVTFYGPPRLVAATLDGEATGLEPSREAGWAAFGDFVDLRSGESARYRLEFDLPPGDAEGEPTVFEMPLATR